MNRASKHAPYFHQFHVFLLPLFLASFTYVSKVNGQYIGANVFTSTISKSNTLYVGIDNILEINLPDTTQWVLTPSSGRLVNYRENMNYMLTKPGNVRIHIYAVNGDTTYVGYKSFKAVYLKNISIFLDTVNVLTCNYLNQKSFNDTHTFYAQIDDDIIQEEAWFVVNKVTISYNTRGNYKTIVWRKIDNKDPITTILKRIPSGTEVIFRFQLASSSGVAYKKPLENKCRVY